MMCPVHVQIAPGQPERLNAVGGSKATVSEPERFAIIENSVFSKVCKNLLLCLVEVSLSCKLVISYSLED
jgi:hypothetical protein